MSQAGHPHPAHVPTLTEVIELLSPTPVGESGLHQVPRPPAPEQGAAGSVPIVTSGLAASRQASSGWTPMSTVVLPSLDSAPVRPVSAMADLPVLEEAVAFDTALRAWPVPELTDAVLAEPEQPPIQVPQDSTLLPAPLPEPVAAHLSATVPTRAEPAEPAAPPAPVLPDVTEAQLAQRVLGDVQKQIDGMLDFRLREALAPILSQYSDALVRELRDELNRTMRDVVARSVAQEMAKLRQR